MRISCSGLRASLIASALGLSLVGLAPQTRAGELRLASSLSHELNQVLKAGDGLHKSLLSRDEEQIEMGLRDIMVQINRAKTASQMAKPHERRHLVRILDAAHEQFELTQSSFGEERRTRLEGAYNQLVNLVRIYRLDAAYGIFFCPKDRTSWIQRGAKPQNPFRGSEGQREPCGMRVPR